MASPSSLRSDLESVAFLRSPLNFVLVVAGLVLFSIAVNGYLAFRYDHLSQIPMLAMKDDPGLFACDWFFQNFGHFKLRFLHLQLIRSLSWAVGIPAALLILYTLCIGSTIAAWLTIARYVYGSALPGIVTALAAILFYGELGANHLIERILIPRAEAFAIIYWGVYCYISGRPLRAGLLFGAASCFQPAVGIQFAFPLLLLTGFTQGKAGLSHGGKFLVAFMIVLGPWLLFLGDSFTGTSNLSDPEIIEVVAWLRHPTLMLPRFFSRSVWAVFILLLVAGMVAWRSHGRSNAGVARLGWLLPVFGGLFGLSAIFIELIPVKALILFQPFRVSVFFYFIAFLILGPHVLEKLRSSDPFCRFRGVLLLASMFVIKLAALMILAELVLAVLQRGGKKSTKGVAVGLAVMVALAGWLIRPDDGGYATTWVLLAVSIALTILSVLIVGLDPIQQARRVRTGLVAGCLAGFIVLASFFFLPWSGWLDSEDSRVRSLAAKVLWRYQIVDAPVRGIERLGVWARSHTDKDALFIIPPEKNPEGFRIWSHRSVVFNVKHFPVTQAAYEEWRERYLAHCGIMDAKSPSSSQAVEEALRDWGTRTLAKKYAQLSAEQLLELAARYGADYVISPSNLDSRALRLVHSEFDRMVGDPGQSQLHLYEVRRPDGSTVATASVPLPGDSLAEVARMSIR